MILLLLSGPPPPDPSLTRPRSPPEIGNDANLAVVDSGRKIISKLACFHGYMDLLPWLRTRGVVLEAGLMDAACYGNNLRMAQYLKSEG